MLDFVCLEREYCDPAIVLAQLSVCAFLGILFLQSGIDKVVNWKDELGWITEHFAKTPFRGVVPQLLAIITIFEVAAGATCTIGAVMLAFTGALVAHTVQMDGRGSLAGSVAYVELELGEQVERPGYGREPLLVPDVLEPGAAWEQSTLAFVPRQQTAGELKAVTEFWKSQEK